MKKQTKLFAFVLTLTLVLGVFTVGALAATEYDNASDIANLTAGENFLVYSNFSSAQAKEYTGTASIPTNNGSTLEMKLADDDSANQVLVVGTNDGGVANNYLQIKNDTSAAGGKNFYLNMDKGAPTLTNEEDQNAFLNSGNTFRDLQYHVMDFDVFFPDGEISITPSVYFYIRGYGNDGKMYDGRGYGTAAVKLGYETNTYGVQFKEVDGNIVLLTPRNMANGSTTFPTVTDTTVITTSNMHVLEKNQWSHVTIIMESVINDRGTPSESDDGIDFIFYTALNGKIVSSFRMNAPSYTTYGANWMQGDMTGVFLRMIRVNAAKIGVGDKMNIDNFAVRTYDRDEYTGNLGDVLEGIVPATKGTATAAAWNMDCKGADLAGWDRNVYNPATMPFGTAVAKIGDAEYTNLAAALNAAQDGDTITMLADSAMNVTVGKNLTINLNGKTVTGVTPANNFTIEQDSNSIVIMQNQLMTVTWYKEDGTTVIAVDNVPYGTVGVTEPDYIPGVSNGWYKTDFNGWATSQGSYDKVDLESFVVNDNVSFYPALNPNSEPTPHITGAEYNLTLTGNITINFYLPQAPAGVTVIGVYNEDGSEIVGKNVTLPNGQSRTMYVVGTVGATELTTASNIHIVFTTVMPGGDTVQLTQYASISPYKYAVNILRDSERETPTQTAATHTLVADMIRYSNLLSKAVFGETVAELDILLERYESLCSELPSDNDFAEYTTSVSPLKGHIHSIYFEVSEMQPRWVFEFTEDMKITNVTVTLDGYYELPVEVDGEKYNFGTITYELDTDESEYSGSYLTTAYIESMPMYNIDRVITITVTNEDGQTFTGTYSLNAYYASVGAGDGITNEQLANIREFLKSLRAFGITSAGYRYADGIKQQGAPAKDFFECNHTKVTNRGPSSNSLNNGLYCSDCQTYVFFYESRIRNNVGASYLFTSREAALAAQYNAYTQIYLCHSAANAAAAKPENQGKKYGCYAGPYFYYLGEARLSSTNTNTGAIPVKTDTNWEGAYFIVDDRAFGLDDSSYVKSVFDVQAFNTTINGTTYTNGGGVDITAALVNGHQGIQSGDRILTPNTKNIGWSNGVPMMIELYDHSQKRYYRYSGNTLTSTASTHEVILIDEFGNVNSTTPIEWDYIYNPGYNSGSGSFKAVAYPINVAPIKLSGLDQNGNISCTFETMPNQEIDVSRYYACKRGIQISTSNVTVEGLEHIMNEDNSDDTPRQAYQGFVRVNYANNTVIKDMLVDKHLNHFTTSGALLGSYEFAANDSINTSWINCVSKDFFNADGSVTYVGLFGTNRSRNNYLKNCVLNNYDAHSGAYNTTIEDSTFEHLNFIGAGNIVLNNVAVYVDGAYSGIYLRHDYGSRWEGNIYIDGLDLRHSGSYSRDYIDLVRASYLNHDFGYSDQTATSGNYLPIEIYAKNVTIHSYTRTSQNYTCTEPGIIDETLNASDIPLGIYEMYEEHTNCPSSNDRNGQKPTTAIYFEGGHITSLDKLCTDTISGISRFRNMKIYINGVEQDWYGN